MIGLIMSSKYQIAHEECSFLDHIVGGVSDVLKQKSSQF